MTNLFDDVGDLSEEGKEQIREIFGLAVDSEVLSVLEDLRYGEQIEDMQTLTEAMADYLDSEVPDAINRLEESLAQIETLIVTLVDTMTPEARERFLKKVANKIDKRPEDNDGQGDQYGASVSDDQAERNRSSLKPGGGTGGGIQNEAVERYCRALSEQVKQSGRLV